MTKRTIYTEASYIAGLLLLAFATALTEAAGFGVSMVVAPAYLIHLRLSPALPFFTFGVAEYFFQASLLLLTVILLKKFRISYLFSFVTALLYGAFLDLFISALSYIPHESIAVRIIFFASGVVICSFAVLLFFHTYIPPEVYELFVKEVSQKFGIELSKLKTIYDCSSCLLGIILSFAFFGFGKFEGIGIGTVICALLNGPLIGLFGKNLEKHFEFKDRFPLRKYLG